MSEILAYLENVMEHQAMIRRKNQVLKSMLYAENLQVYSYTVWLKSKDIYPYFWVSKCLEFYLIKSIYLTYSYHHSSDEFQGVVKSFNIDLSGKTSFKIIWRTNVVQFEWLLCKYSDMPGSI